MEPEDALAEDDWERRCAAKYLEVLERTGDQEAAEQAYTDEMNNSEYIPAVSEPMTFAGSADGAISNDERRELAILSGCLVLVFAVSGGAWYLSITHVGYWWTVLLAQLLGD